MFDDQLFEKVYREKPRLHFWGNRWTTAGYENDALLELVRVVKLLPEEDSLVAIEVGAGLTTLTLLCFSPSKYVVVCAEQMTFEAIDNYCLSAGISCEVMMKICELSQIALPKVAFEESQPSFNFGIIDGGHNFTQCWVDYVYINSVLKKGGILLVDDTEIYSCRTLALWLKSHPGWEGVGGYPARCSFFRKKTDDRWDGDFGSSPYILANTL